MAMAMRLLAAGTLLLLAAASRGVSAASTSIYSSELFDPVRLEGRQMTLGSPHAQARGPSPPSCNSTFYALPAAR